MTTQKLATHHRKELWTEACNEMLLLKALERLPKKQMALPTSLLLHTANSLGISQASFAILFCEGVLRRNGNAIEIWAPDDAAPEIKMLLSQARGFKRLLDRGEFIMRIPLDEGFACCVMPLREEMTVQDLKAVAAVSCGVLSEKLRMTQLGQELKPPGLLVEKVSAGSCITISILIEC